VEPHGEESPHVPPPTLWPVGFAIGIAVLLVGLVVSNVAVVVGAVLAIVFGFLWVRDLTRDVRQPAPAQPEATQATGTAPALPAQEGGPALPAPEPGETFPRNKFLEGATLGLGAVIGGLVTLPILGFTIAPAFLKQGHPDIDLGPMSNFPEGQFVVATFLLTPTGGAVANRTAYIRNNGTTPDNKISFTVISNRCAHLGCPVQPNGLLFNQQAKSITTTTGHVHLIPMQPAGFGCPCHGGQYDTEGNRTAGPPVRALDRYEFLIKHGRLFLGNLFSVAHVTGAGASAKIYKHPLTGPGQHVDGPEAWLYPIQPPTR
jgi:menaquinol-cytochrome c reductase iron-sulfur subunit